MTTSLGELAVQFGLELVGDPSASVSRVATLAHADADSLSFFANKAYRQQLRETHAGAVILHRRDVADCPVNALLVDDPYLAYARIATLMHPPVAVVPGIHAAAVVASSAKVSATAQIAPNAVIDEDAVIGENAYIGAGAVVGPRCSVGDASRVLANATLVQDVRLGDRCIVHSGAVLGSDGFGNAQSAEGWVKVPQLGGVVVGDDVEIGANTTVDRGTLGDTMLGNGVRLDNLIQIAHNVQVGEHTAMAAFTGISGSTIIGRRCLFAGRAGVVGHIRICDDVVVGGATMISKDIDEPGFYTASFPGEKHRDWKRQVARFRRLDDLAKRVGKLEKMANNNDD